MTKTEIARLKKLLSGPVGKRLDKANPANAAPLLRVRNKDSRRKATRVLAATLDRSAAKTFAAIVEQDRSKLDARLKKIKADAVRASRDRQRALKVAAAQYLNEWQQVVQLPLDPGQIGHILLNVPFDISPGGDAELEQSQIIENNSFAKFRASVEDGDEFRGEARFSFVWVNPKTTFEVINISGFVIFNGHCTLGTGGGIFPGDRHASVTVEGRLEILNVSNNPPTSPPGQSDQFVTALTMSEDTGGWSEVGAIDARDLFRGSALNHAQMIVPPQATIVFVVVASVRCDTGDDSSNAGADFASGAFQVGSPAVLLATLT
jgi:hypothetical protein